MGIQDRTKFISEHLSKQIDHQAQLNYTTPNYPKNMLKSTLQNCKYIVKLSTISLSAIGLILTSQPKKAEASTNTNILNRLLSKSSQTVLNLEDKLTRKKKSSVLTQDSLSSLNISQNIQQKLLSKLLFTEIVKPINGGKLGQFSNTFKINNSYNQNLSLATQPNWSSPNIKLSNDKPIISSEINSQEYIFQIPSFENTQTQQGKDSELNSKLSKNKDIVKQTYMVKEGDTLNEIASIHGVSRQELIEKNNIRNPYLIFVSQQIKIPQAKATTIVAQNKRQRDNSLKQDFAPQLSGLDNSEMENYEDIATNPIGMNITLGTTLTPELPPLSSPEQYLPASPAAEFNGYIWPAKGTLTSGYGWRWGRPHRGIDIAAPIGTPILAAASGEVISAGWNSGGYGNLVKLKHPNGSVTLYAHNHKLLVRRGQKVQQGQQIAQMGSTGYSTGSHLHFEIRSNGKKAVNPIAYLPKK